MSKYKVLSASVQVDNSGDAEREYAIRAQFATQNGELTGIDSGIVEKEGVNLAYFNKNFGGENNMNVTFYGEAADNAETQCEVTAAVNTFITEATAIAVKEAEEEN